MPKPQKERASEIRPSVHTGYGHERRLSVGRSAQFRQGPFFNRQRDSYRSFGCKESGPSREQSCGLQGQPGEGRARLSPRFLAKACKSGISSGDRLRLSYGAAIGALSIVCAREVYSEVQGDASGGNTGPLPKNGRAVRVRLFGALDYCPPAQARQSAPRWRSLARGFLRPRGRMRQRAGFLFRTGASALGAVGRHDPIGTSRRRAVSSMRHAALSGSNDRGPITRGGLGPPFLYGNDPCAWRVRV
jgi:hypothetical protein